MFETDCVSSDLISISIHRESIVSSLFLENEDNLIHDSLLNTSYVHNLQLLSRTTKRHE